MTSNSSAQHEVPDFSIERQRHSLFVGRRDVLALLDTWLLHPSEVGWVVITGGPGMGKSAVLTAWLAQRERAGAAVPHHFIRRQVADWDQPAVVAVSLSAQLEAMFPALRDPQASPSRRLIELLGRISKQLGPADNLVVLIDGLDETYAEPSENPLPRFLPHHIPAGIRFLCATRPTYPHLSWIEARNPIRRIDLDENKWAASNEALVRGFWETVSADYTPPLSVDLQAAAIERAEGNVLHAVMMNDLLRDTPPAERRVDRLPRGLKALFGDIWIQTVSQPSVRTGLGLLCAAQEALSLDVLARLAEWKADERDRFIPAARQLLAAETSSWGRAELYRPRHEWVRELIAERLGAIAICTHHATLATRLATWPFFGGQIERRYSLRYALTHRMEMNAPIDAWHLASNLDFLGAKIQEFGAHEAEADISRTAERCRGIDEAAHRRFKDLEHALSRESHWLHVVPEETAALVWNGLRRLGWNTDDLNQHLQLPVGASFLKLRQYTAYESPELLRSLIGPIYDIASSFAVTPDSSRVVAASLDKTLKVWELNSGRILPPIRLPDSETTSFPMVLDGRHAVTLSATQVFQVWDLESGRLASSLRGDVWATACAITSDGSYLVSALGDNTLKVWDLASGCLLASLEGHNDLVHACTVTQDCRLIVSASRDHTLKIWDLASGRLLTSLHGHNDAVRACAVTPDGLRVISASDDTTLKVWELTSGRLLASLEGHSGSVQACAVTPDGLRVVSASVDQTLRVWDLDMYDSIASLHGHSADVLACIVTPDGRHIVSADSHNTLKVWTFPLDSDRPSIPVQRHATEVMACAVTPDSLHGVSMSRNGILNVWDIDSNHSLKSLKLHRAWITACWITPDRRQIISAAYDNTLHVSDIANEEFLTEFKDGEFFVKACALLPNHQNAAFISHDKILEIWDLISCRCLRSFQGHTSSITACAPTTDGRIVVSASSDRTLKIWDCASGILLASLEGHTSAVAACAITPDSRHVVSASFDHTLKVWEIDSGRLVASLEGHSGPVVACAVSPDSRRIGSVSFDNTLKVWDIDSGICIFTYRASAKFSAITFTESFILAGNIIGDVQLLDWLPSEDPRRDKSVKRVKPERPRHEIFVIHANNSADTAFVRTELVPALDLPPGQILLSSELLPGQSIIGGLEKGIISSRFTVVVWSPFFQRDTWAAFGEALASHIAATSGALVPLILDDSEMPPHLNLMISLDCREPRMRSEAFRRLRTLVTSL